MNRIQIRTKDRKFPVAKDLYGLFFEDINRSGDSGLYPEQLRNRSFEDSLIPEECTLNDDGVNFTTPTGWVCEFNGGEGLARWTRGMPKTPIPAWYAGDGAAMSLNMGDTLNHNRKCSLDITFDANGGSVHNVGYAGINAKAGEEYRFFFFAKAIGDSSVVTFSLEGEDGTVYDTVDFQILTGGFARYDHLFQSSGTDRKARLVIRGKAGAIRLGFISLMPADTYKGRENGLRKDVVEMLKGLHPTFMRFPGGCIVEGYSKENAVRFSQMIGPVWERPSNYLLWFYRTTNGFGYHEYLLLCEDLGMSAMYVANCGLTCQGRKPDLWVGDELEDMYQECVAAIEYAIAPVGTKYGDMRAAAGHPEPFDLKYLEIGNENLGEDYNVRYKMFYDRLKAAYPQLIYISNTHTEEDGLPTEVADEHFYSDLEFFVSHHERYDSYDRSGPEIFVGEYAVTVGDNMSSLGAAIGEAAFLTGIERNQDIVTLTAYAPMMLNEDFMSWIPDLIVYNNDKVYGVPSYYALQMFAKHRGTEVVGSDVEADIKYLDFPGKTGIGAEKPGAVFQNITIDGERCKDYINIPGNFRAVGEFEGKDGVFTSISDNAYALVDQQERKLFTLEAEVKVAKDNAATLSIWNYTSDGGYAAEDERSVVYDGLVFYMWKIENGVSCVYAKKGRPEALVESVELNIDFNVFNSYKIVTNDTGFDCYVNGEKVHSVTMVSMPVYTASTTVDDNTNEVVLKLVNPMDETLNIPVSFDCDVTDTATVEILTGDGKTAKNTMEDRECVVPEEWTISGIANPYTYAAPANSISIIRFKMK